MSDLIRVTNDAAADQAKRDPGPEVVSAARRWIVKAGLTVPVILTLRSKPLFGDNCTASVMMSLTYGSHHQEPCTPLTAQQPTQQTTQQTITQP